MRDAERILVTGAGGFIGAHLVRRLKSEGCAVSAAVRRADSELDVVPVGEIGPDTDWTPALEGVTRVVHLAGRAHVMKETGDPSEEYRRVNVLGTQTLALAAAAAGVRRLVFVSSVKVNGESASPDHPFRESDPPRPVDAYGISKLEAEKKLEQIAVETGLEAIIVRPPLVYGPGVKGNFLRLLNIVDRGIPLPFKSIDNRRSLVGVGNLCDFLYHALMAPAAAGETFLISDGRDLSTAGLIGALAQGLGRPARLFSFPPKLLETAARLAGRAGVYERLAGSLAVDSGKARQTLNWSPPESVEQGLAATTDWYRGRQQEARS